MKSGKPLKLFVFFALAASIVFSPARAALIGHYRMEEGAIDSNTNITYCSVSANTGTIDPGSGSLVWVTSGLANVPPPGTTAALQFTAVSPSGSTGNPNVTTTLMTGGSDGNGLAGPGAKTITAWIKPAVVQNDANATIVHFGQASPNGARVTFKLASGAGGYVTRVEVQGSGYNGTVNVADGNWHHVAVVIPANATVSQSKLYVDGATTGTPSGSVAFNTFTNYPVVIGATTGSGLVGDRGFTGLIDDVRIYNEALSASDILNLYLGSGAAPSITALSNQYLVLGSTNSTVAFNAGAIGTPPLQIQWKHNGTDLPNETNDSLTISPAGLTDLGTYTVAVTNAYGYTNKSVTLMLNTAPINPPRQAVISGQPATFSVSMPVDSTGYTFQWRTNGVDIPGATSSSLTLSSASATDMGTNYQVVVTLGGNSATSAPPATLNVLTVPSSQYAQFVLESVPAGYWRLGEGNGAGVAVDQTGFYSGGYSNYTGSELGYPGALLNDADTASYFTGAGNYVQVGYNAQLTRADGLTLETWVNPDTIGAKQSLIDCHGGLPIFGYELFISTTGNAVFRTYSSTSPAAPTTDDLSGGMLVAGSWTHIVATYDGTTKRLYVNGALVGTQTVAYFPAVDVNLRFGAGIGGAGAVATPLIGKLDEVAIYSRPLSAGEVQDHYFIGTYGTGVPVSITTQPTDQQFILGDTNAMVNFSVLAGGSPHFYYQWKKGVEDVVGGIDATLTIFPASATDLGTYSVLVSNSVNAITSDTVTLSYGTGPVSPGVQTVLQDSPATFTLTGMPDYQAYTYQWKHDGTNIPSATNSSLTLNSVSAEDAGNYSVLVVLGADSAESAPATLNVVPSPTQAYSEVVSNDTPVAWWRLDEPAGSYGATDLIGYRYASSSYGDYYGDIRWEQGGALLGDNDTSVSFTGYSAGGRAGHPMMDVPYDGTLDSPMFSVEFWAMLTGEQAGNRSPLTSRNFSTGVEKGFSFYVNSSDVWQFELYDGTGSSVISGPTAGKNEWAHIVGTYDGTKMSFYVNGVLVDSKAATYAPNDAYPLRIGAGASESTSGNYFWPGRVDEVAVYNYALSEAQVQSHYAAAFPSDATPRFTVQPRTLAAIQRQTATLNVKVHSTLPVSYQWKHAGTNIPGATSATLVLDSATAADAGSYQVVASHGAASANSSSADLTVLPGQAVSVNLEGFENARTVAANGGVAGYVAAQNWNEIGYNASSGTATGLINDQGQASPMSVTWTSSNNRRWNGPFDSAASSDGALLNGFVDGGTSNIVVTVSNIPSSYQSAGYSVYVYLGAPHATSGLVDSGTWFGAVSVNGSTNYYHAMDLATWDGTWVRATETDPNNSIPADANYAVFAGLTSPTLQITVDQHPLALMGPPTFSGLQIVSDVATVATNPTNITWSVSGGQISLSWPADHLGWTLQTQTNALSTGLSTNWVDVPGSAAVTNMTMTIDPMTPAVFYRLRP